MIVFIKNLVSGFTLLELLVVISLIGILSFTVVISTDTARAKSRDSQRIMEKQAIVKAFNSYFAEHGDWPSSGINGSRKCLAPTVANCWLGPVSGLDSLVSDLTPYISPIPTNNASSGTLAYRYYTYGSNVDVDSLIGFGDWPRGAWIVWIQETNMSNAKCPNDLFNKLDKYYYCFEFLGLP